MNLEDPKEKWEELDEALDNVTFEIEDMEEEIEGLNKKLAEIDSERESQREMNQMEIDMLKKNI